MGIFEEANKSTNSLWCEQYRPQVLDEYIGNENLKVKIKSFIEKSDIPHLLFHGKAGVGKTTLAKLLINSIDCDSIIINASDENDVETVRNKIKGFVSTLGFKNLKIIVLDEVDYMTPNAQAILRNLMESFSKHCRFILTCNYIFKVIDPIESRCQTFQIIPPNKKDIETHVGKILLLKRVNFKQDVLNKIIDSYYPDIRKIINNCQLSSSKGELKLDIGDIVDSDVKCKIVDILKSKDDNRDKYLKSRKAVADARIQDFSELYSHLYDTVDDYAHENPMEVIHIISEGQYKDAIVVDKEIVFISTFIKIINQV